MLADRYWVQSMSPRALPMDPKLQFVKDMGPLKDASERYRALVGAMLHLANCTRPDITFAVGVLSQGTLNPNVKRLCVLRTACRCGALHRLRRCVAILGGAEV